MFEALLQRKISQGTFVIFMIHERNKSECNLKETDIKENIFTTKTKQINATFVMDNTLQSKI